jgi:subtilisin-like proprotein convertase family protein
MDLLSTISPSVNPRGNWTLHVKDLKLGDTGTLIQWRILLVGNT